MENILLYYVIIGVVLALMFDSIFFYDLPKSGIKVYLMVNIVLALLWFPILLGYIGLILYNLFIERF